MLQKLKNAYHYYNIPHLRRRPFLWIYAAYLTLRFVDKRGQFPAIRFNSYVRIRIKKGRGANLNILDRLVVESWLNGKGTTAITLDNNAVLSIEREFLIGDGIKIYIATGGKLVLKGKENESASGITANSVVMVRKYLEIGKDCIIAWDTFLTDCDWHSIDGKKSTIDTVIGDHVWIGAASKILKGVKIGPDSIIASNSVVLQGTYPDQVLIGGNPGKIIRDNAPHWHRDLREI